jgi:hypothetical protein
MKKKVVVNDKMQKGYVYYLTEMPGKKFDPDFKPDLTPKQMLKLGIFGGVYMRDCRKEFPKDWFARAKFASGKKDAKLNCFKVHASQPLKVWKYKNWIYNEDPRGWFQWYCRYHMGRRLEWEDKRQIKRWKAIGRHVGAIMKNCKKRDLGCRPRQRQAVLHWAIDGRKI